MGGALTRKVLYAFAFVLPLLFYSGIGDTGLLPRQLLLSAFGLFLIPAVWRSVSQDSVRLDAVNAMLIVYVLFGALMSFLSKGLIAEVFYGLSKWWLISCFTILIALSLRGGMLRSKNLITAGIVFGIVAVATVAADFIGKLRRGDHLLHWVYLVRGNFGNKNLLASVLFLSLPFFMIGIREKRLTKYILGIAAFLVLLILVVIRTRTALIATCLFFAIVAITHLPSYSRRTRFIAASIVSLTIAGIVGFSLSGGAEIQKYYSRLLNTDTFIQRLLFWQNSWQMFLDHPFGVGWGNWPIYAPAYGLEKFGAPRIVNGILTLQRPHNDFLGILCETGIVGFAAFLGVFGMAIYQSFKLIRLADDNREKWMFANLFAGIVGFMVVAFFDFPMERIEHLVLLVLIFGLVIFHYQKKVSDSRAVSVGKLPLMLFLTAGVLFSLIVAWNRFNAEKEMFKLYKARKEGYPEEVIRLATRAESVFYKIDSRSIPLAWYKGVAHFSQKQYADGEKSFQTAYELTPYNIHVINNLASSREMNGKRPDAIRLYRKALKISPYFDEARLNLAAVYFNGNEYQKAFETIDSCSVNTKDSKYKIFLPPILKAKAISVLERVSLDESSRKKDSLINSTDFLSFYYDAKKNNVTFERQIINQLQK